MANNVSFKDECGVIAHLQELAVRDCSREHCAIAVANKSGREYRLYSYCMVQDVGGNTNDQFSVIPRKVSYALLNMCNREKAIPVILHTHILGYEYSRPLGFSPQDTEFADKFIQLARQMGNISDCGFVVMNGEDIVIFVQNMNAEVCDAKEG